MRPNRDKEIQETLRTLEQNRIINYINDLWKADPSLSLSEIVRLEDGLSDSELEKRLKEQAKNI